MVKEDGVATAIVTGGAGFLGRHLCSRLLAAGRRVICVDNFYTGSRRNIAAFARHPRFTLLRHDVRLPLHLPVDEIYNFACPASPRHYQREPVTTLQTSVLGAAHILELARQSGAKVLQASTSEIYGDPHEHPQRERYWGHVNPIGVRACYDEGKRCVEAMCFDYRRQFGVRTKVARIFNTYGPYMQLDDGRVVSSFVVQALRGEPITIYGDGTQTRSFCYVDDLVDGLVRLMDAPDDIAGPVNLGNPDEFTITELADRVMSMTGTRVPVVQLPLPHDDPRQRRPDIGLAKQLLGWVPRVELASGLELTIDYFRRRLGQAGRARGDAPAAVSGGRPAAV